MEKIKCNIILFERLQQQLSQLREMERKLPQPRPPAFLEDIVNDFSDKKTVSYMIEKIESYYESQYKNALKEAKSNPDKYDWDYISENILFDWVIMDNIKEFLNAKALNKNKNYDCYFSNDLMKICWKEKKKKKKCVMFIGFQKKIKKIDISQMILKVEIAPMSLNLKQHLNILLHIIFTIVMGVVT
jgi:hypothetical protein